MMRFGRGPGEVRERRLDRWPKCDRNDNPTLSKRSCMTTQVWLVLLGAILLEVSGTTAMKLSEGFTKMGPSMMVLVFYGASFACLALTLKVIDVSVAYAVWAGLGTALIAVIGFVCFAEPVSWVRVACIALIVVGVFGLNLTGSH